MSQTLMRNFTLDKGLRHNADDLATGRERTIRDGAHKTNMSAAIYDRDTTLCGEASECICCMLISWFTPFGRATENGEFQGDLPTSASTDGLFHIRAGKGSG
ncbi:hypothetical protein AA13594_2429 [Gluconacetobacter azotocaptans DSM 13594]|nr:hypothetical protein AA13594_2429 [Gluconacetobacter azotocaptans DSM 13594]